MASATDDFAGTGALSGNWTTQFGAPARGAGVFGGTDAVNGNGAFYSGLVWANNQSCQAKFAGLSAASFIYAEIHVRESAGTNYYVYYTDSGSGSSSNTGISVYISGSETVLQVLNGLSNGDTGYIEAVGTTIKVKQNGSQIGTNQTDSSLSSGAPGIAIFPTGSSLDDFAGADISSGSASDIYGTIARRRLNNSILVR